MKILCPVCASSYQVADEKLTRPLSRATCKKCGTALLIDKNAGEVRTGESSIPEPDEIRPADEAPGEDTPPVFTMSSNEQMSRDYLAGGIFVAAVILLLILGFLFIRNISFDSFRKPIKAVSRLLEDSQRVKKRKPVRAKRSVRPKTARESEFLNNYNQGHKLFREKKYEEALRAYSKAIQIDPKNAGPYYWRGRLLIATGEKDRALGDLKKTVELDPSNREAYDNLGWLASQKGQYEDGITYLTKSIQMKPDNAWAYYQRGFCYFKKGNQEMALKDTKKSCDLGYDDGCKAFKQLKK
ncbi:tetratricopeptide repeat protein [Thermodesulfobacteriota bacterium]